MPTRSAAAWAHFTAGATHVCLQPIHADGGFVARDRMLAALADT
jgi:hypothetical protein